MIIGTSLLHTLLQRFGMLVHAGSRATESSEGSKSNTEAVYFPCGDTLLIRSKQILPISTKYVTAEAS